MSARRTNGHEGLALFRGHTGVFSLLEKHSVQYLVVGGEAVICHGHIRPTGDVDVFYRRSGDNADRLFAALEEF